MRATDDVTQFHALLASGVRFCQTLAVRDLSGAHHPSASKPCAPASTMAVLLNLLWFSRRLND
jgi:hypothetical protein